LLEHRLGSELSKGQIQNISHEMLDDELWEQYADMPLHERLFHVGSFFYQAFPQLAPVPDAARVHLEVRARNDEGERTLAGRLHESFLVRLLADGMPESAALHRLFGEAVRGAPFPEAESIVWILNSERVDARTLRLFAIGAGQWLDPLRETKSYGSEAHADE